MLIKKANLISIVLFVIAVLFVYFSSKVEAAPATFWFNNAVNTSPLEIGNYWLDSGQTNPALALPNFSSDILHIVAGATFNGDAVFNLTGTNSGIVTGNAIFYSDSSNLYPTGQVNGDATFYGHSIDSGIIYGDAFFYNASLHEQANAYGDITFFDNAICSISNNYGYVTFNDDSVNIGILVTNATFNDRSINTVGVQGDAIFNDSSLNQSSITGDVIFNNTSENTSIGSVYGNATFNDSAINNNDIFGGATFVNDLSENAPSATATTKTREYTINTTTTRNFVTDGPWTVIANGVVVNVSGSIYNSLTVFTKLNGGSFIPSFDPPSGSNNIWIQTPAQGPFGIEINNNAKETDNRLVNVQISSGTNITRMTISRNSLFENVNLIPLAPQIEWDICGSNLTCSEGMYTVFVRFYTEYGQVSETISDSIWYKPKNVSIETKNSVSKDIALPTIESRNTQIDSTITLKLFTRYLRYRNVHAEVKQLQQFLNAHNFPLRVGNRGAGSPGRETFYFGPYTRRALQRYQRAHALPVTSVLDSATRRSINSELEKEKK